MFHFCRTAQPLTPALPWVVASLLITAHEHLEPPWVLSGWEQALKRTDFTPKRYQCSHLMPGAESGTAGTTLEMPAMPSCDGQAGKSGHCKASNSPEVTQQAAGPAYTQTQSCPPPILGPARHTPQHRHVGSHGSRLIPQSPVNSPNSEQQNYPVTQQFHSWAHPCPELQRRA